MFTRRYNHYEYTSSHPTHTHTQYTRIVLIQRERSGTNVVNRAARRPVAATNRAEQTTSNIHSAPVLACCSHIYIRTCMWFFLFSFFFLNSHHVYFIIYIYIYHLEFVSSHAIGCTRQDKALDEQHFWINWMIIIVSCRIINRIKHQYVMIWQQNIHTNTHRQTRRGNELPLGCSCRCYACYGPHCCTPHWAFKIIAQLCHMTWHTLCFFAWLHYDHRELAF